MKKPPREFDGPTPNPGSTSALAAGCSCSPQKNRNGAGAGKTFKGEMLFVVNPRCPIHRAAA